MRVTRKAVVFLSLSSTKPLFLHFCINKFLYLLSFHSTFPSFPGFALITAHEYGEAQKDFPAWYLLLSCLRLQAENFFERYACSLSRPVPAPAHFPQRSLRQGTQKKAYSSAGYPSGQAMKFSRFSERGNVRMFLRTLPSH